MQLTFNIFEDCYEHHHKRDDDDFPYIVWLVLNKKTKIRMTPNKELKIMDQLNIAQVGNYAIVVTDTAGDVISAPVYDSPPAWTSSNTAAATIVASADGTTAVLTPAGKPGDVTNVGLSASIGGVTFTATDQVTLVVGPAANVAIVMTAVPKP